jgi:hypothetical protein
MIIWDPEPFPALPEGSQREGYPLTILDPKTGQSVTIDLRTGR